MVWIHPSLSYIMILHALDTEFILLFLPNLESSVNYYLVEIKLDRLLFSFSC